jgi:hypothetical protein
MFPLMQERVMGHKQQYQSVDPYCRKVEVRCKGQTEQQFARKWKNTIKSKPNVRQQMA